MGAPVTFLVDTDRPSYVEAAELYEHAFAAAGIAVRSIGLGAGNVAPGGWVLHHTIGPLFRPIAGAHNTAVVFHEWDRYPAAWVATLNTFQSVWAPSTHVAETLAVSGVRVPVHQVPPPVAARRVPVKTSWHVSPPFRFLSIGEAHFRKGFHLLIDGFLQAFPVEGEATLTIKVPRACVWQSPRADITFVADRLEREDLLTLYCTHDAYVTASLGEGLGLPVAESALAALPAVLNWWGGHRDLVRLPDCWPISYDVVPQIFCSDPSYYARGQRCAYSAPEKIAASLRAAATAPAAERESRARRAQAALEESHGTARISTVVGQHYETVQASRPGLACAPVR